MLPLFLAVQGAPEGLDGIFSVILGGSGVMGAVFLMLAFDFGIHSNGAYKGVIGERDRERAINAQLMTMLQMQVVPALSRQNDVVEASTAKDEAFIERLDALVAKLEASGGTDDRG